MRLPGFIKMGLFAGLMAASTAGTTYLLNSAYNDDEVLYFLDGAKEYHKVDGLYAHTILTKSKNYLQLKRNSLQESKTYISYGGCSSVDAIILKSGLFGTGAPLEYRRITEGELKESLFAKADAELKEQCERFRPLMKKPYFP